jgi:tetratricopeptide (TPR) repeat protein
LVLEVIRERLPDEQRGAILQSALWMVNNYLPSEPPPTDVRSWPIWDTMGALVRELIPEAIKARIGHPTSRLAGMLGMFIAEKNLWPEAESLARLALEMDKRMLGHEHPDVAISLNNLALLLKATNRLGQAEPLYRRALEIDEKNYGSDQPRVATGLNNLARLYYAQGQYAKAYSITNAESNRAWEIGLSALHPGLPTNLPQEPEGGSFRWYRFQGS